MRGATAGARVSTLTWPAMASCLSVTSTAGSAGSALSFLGALEADVCAAALVHSAARASAEAAARACGCGMKGFMTALMTAIGRKKGHPSR